MNPIALLLTVLLVAQASPLVTLTTDRGWYSPGESVVIHILTTGEHGGESLLWLYVDGPDGRNVYFSDLPFRSQKLNWTIPIDAVEGTYTVTVTWDHRYSQTGFTVEGQPIPEFPFAPLVLIVATIAVLALAWRKTGARAEASIPHP